jgi:hypothetical protein
VLLIITGCAGRTKSKGTDSEHRSPHIESTIHALTVKEFVPMVDIATSILIDPSICAGTVAGTHAGPVNLYPVTPVCGSHTRNGDAKTKLGINKNKRINFFI